MDKQVQEITTDVTETGEIELVSYEWAPDKASFPRHADVLRYTAYDQAKDLADALDKTLHKTFATLWEWQYDLNRTRDRAERMEQLDKALKELDESDKTDNQ